MPSGYREIGSRRGALRRSGGGRAGVDRDCRGSTLAGEPLISIMVEGEKDEKGPPDWPCPCPSAGPNCKLLIIPSAWVRNATWSSLFVMLCTWTHSLRLDRTR